MSDLSRLKVDLDFVKTLAVEWAQAPLNSSFPLFFAGLIFGGAPCCYTPVGNWVGYKKSCGINSAEK